MRTQRQAFKKFEEIKERKMEKIAEIYVLKEFTFTLTNLHKQSVKCMISKENNEKFTSNDIHSLFAICKKQIVKMYRKKKIDFFLTHKEKENILITPFID